MRAQCGVVTDQFGWQIVRSLAHVREIPYVPEGHVGAPRSRVARYCVCIEYNESQSVLATHRAAKQRVLPLTTVVGDWEPDGPRLASVYCCGQTTAPSADVQLGVR